MTARRNRFALPVIGTVSTDSPICGRTGCRHPRIRHYTDVKGVPHCGATITWPHTDKETGRDVPYERCACPGFVSISTVEGQ